MRITYYGQSCVLLQAGGKNILFDPFISFNEMAKDINIEAIPANYILLSHGHFDHIADAVSIAKRTGATVVCNWEIHEWMQKQGLSKTHPMNTGGKWTFDFGQVKCVHAVHSSGLPDGSYGGNPMGFIIYTNEGQVYHAGDTALTYDMKLIGEFEKLSVALLPIGGNFTMDAEDAVRAASFINCRKIIGMHYDTFPYIAIDHEQTKQKFLQAGLSLTLPEIGKTYDIT